MKVDSLRAFHSICGFRAWKVVIWEFWSLLWTVLWIKFPFLGGGAGMLRFDLSVFSVFFFFFPWYTEVLIVKIWWRVRFFFCLLGFGIWVFGLVSIRGLKLITRGLLISFMDLDADLGINHWLGGFGDIVKFPSLSVGAGLVSFDLPVFFFWVYGGIDREDSDGFLMISCWIECQCCSRKINAWFSSGLIWKW